MSEASEQSIKKAGTFAKAFADLAAKVLMAIAGYIEKESEFAPQRELAAWIRKKGNVSLYTVQGKCEKELKYELDKKGFPYIDTKNGLLVKTPDLEAIKELNRKILITKSNYYQEVNGYEMENAIASFDKMRDKEIFCIHDLNKYEVEVLKNKCNNITSGFMVGITQTGENLYDISISGGKTFNPDPEKKDFCEAYMQMALSLYGPNSDVKMEQIDADEKIDNAIRALKNDKDVHYIVGADDKTKYIEINAQGFEYYETGIDKKTDKKFDRQVSKCDINDPNYDSELQIYMDKIFNKAILNSSEELSAHLSSKERNIDSDRPRRNKKQYENKIGTDLIEEKINSMIKARMMESGISFPDHKDVFEFYQREATNILESVITKTSITGYRDADMFTISKIMEEKKIDPKTYKNSLNALKNFSCETHRARQFSKSQEREGQFNGNTNR